MKRKLLLGLTGIGTAITSLALVVASTNTANAGPAPTDTAIVLNKGATTVTPAIGAVQEVVGLEQVAYIVPDAKQAVPDQVGAYTLTAINSSPWTKQTAMVSFNKTINEVATVTDATITATAGGNDAILPTVAQMTTAINSETANNTGTTSQATTTANTTLDTMEVQGDVVLPTDASQTFASGAITFAG
jgi:hypothetical protein